MRHLPALICIILSAGFAWVFYERYWKWRDCIEAAASSCVTPDGDNLVAGGAMWSVVSLACLLAAVVFFLRSR